MGAYSRANGPLRANDFHFGRFDRHPRQFGNQFRIGPPETGFGNPQALFLAAGFLVLWSRQETAAAEESEGARRRAGARARCELAHGCELALHFPRASRRLESRQCGSRRIGPMKRVALAIRW